MSQLNQNTQGVQAQVLYEYEAHDDDQLTIKPGDIITIIDDSQDLNGWALAQKGDREGYVPAEYVRYMEQPAFDYQDSWKPQGFETYYTTVLSQEHHLPFFVKLRKAVLDVLIPCPCSKYGYVMSRSDLRSGAILSLVFALVVSLVDAFSLMSPCIPFAAKSNEKATGSQIAVAMLNIAFRLIALFVFIGRYPRPNLIFTSFPFLNVISSLTYSIRVYEAIEMGDNKEYDAYRYYRTWMWASLINLPFEVAALILVILGDPGLIAVSVLVLVWNIINAGRCFLAQWAMVESGNDIHPDFEATIKKYKL